MTKKIIFLSLVACLLFLVTAPAFAANTITLPNPLCPRDAAGNPINPDNCIQDIPGLVARISTYITGVIGALAIVMFVWAGILFVTSGGSPGQIDKAKKALLYAIIGVAIAVAGAGLVAVINQVIGQAPGQAPGQAAQPAAIGACCFWDDSRNPGGANGADIACREEVFTACDAREVAGGNIRSSYKGNGTVCTGAAAVDCP